MASGPYPPENASLGGVPSTTIDIPLSGVFILLFALSAASNMTIFQLNLRRGHKFILSGVLFGFSMARISANALRIVWARYPSTLGLEIAATVFLNAGVVLLFIANLVLAQRLLRAHLPRIMWHRNANAAFAFLYFSVFACFVMLIVTLVYSFFTLQDSALARVRAVQLFALTYLALLAFLPALAAAVCALVPPDAVEQFGKGSMRAKLLLVGGTSLMLSLGAGFRAGITYDPRPAAHPAWYHSRAALYCFDFVIEILVVFTYLVSRFDRRFHVPDGSCAAGDYAKGRPVLQRPDEEGSSGAEGVAGSTYKESDADRSTNVSLHASQMQDLTIEKKEPAAAS